MVRGFGALQRGTGGIPAELVYIYDTRSGVIH